MNNIFYIYYSFISLFTKILSIFNQILAKFLYSTFKMVGINFTSKQSSLLSISVDKPNSLGWDITLSFSAFQTQNKQNYFLHTYRNIRNTKSFFFIDTSTFSIIKLHHYTCFFFTNITLTFIEFKETK